MYCPKRGRLFSTIKWEKMMMTWWSCLPVFCTYVQLFSLAVFTRSVVGRQIIIPLRKKQKLNWKNSLGGRRRKCNKTWVQSKSSIRYKCVPPTILTAQHRYWALVLFWFKFGWNNYIWCSPQARGNIISRLNRLSDTLNRPEVHRLAQTRRSCSEWND